jgi:hypothetical protein
MSFMYDVEKYQIAFYIDSFNIHYNYENTYIKSFFENLNYYLKKNNYKCCKKDTYIIFNTIQLLKNKKIDFEIPCELIKSLSCLNVNIFDSYENYMRFQCILYDQENIIKIQK